MLNKTALLLKLITKDPMEFYDRIRNILEVKYDNLFRLKGSYSEISKNEMVERLGLLFHSDLNSYLNSPDYLSLQQHIIHTKPQLITNGPFNLMHNADFSLAEICYLACRVLQPETVVETGVAYGVTSAFILEALYENNKGELYSIDLPPLAQDPQSHVGFFVPEHLKQRWHLYFGSSRRILPSLVHSLNKIDIFIHDSLHTYGNIAAELSIVTKYLKSPGIVIADDVQDNQAFSDWCHQHQPVYCGVVREHEKDSLFGVSVVNTTPM